MTEAELLNLAAQHARAATVSLDEWILHVKQPGYRWRQSHYGKALIALEQLRKLGPDGAPMSPGAGGSSPPPPLAALTLQRTIFWANITDDAVQHASRLKGWRHALSADPGVDPDTGEPYYAPTLEQVNALKGASAGVDAWGNQLEIGTTTITLFKGAWGLDREIHQAESQPEASLVTASHCIGTFTREALGVQWDRLKALVDRGKLACSHEAYDGNPSDDDTQGLAISSFSIGAAMDKGVHYPLADLLAKTPPAARSSVCIWHGAGLTPAEWEVLRLL